MLHFRDEDQAVDRVVNELTKFDSITVCLAKKNLTMARARVLFDTPIYYILQTKVRLSSDANNAEYVAFEAALVKIQAGRAIDLSKDRQAAMKCLINSGVEAPTFCEKELSLANIAFSKLRAQSNSPIRV